MVKIFRGSCYNAFYCYSEIIIGCIGQTMRSYRLVKLRLESRCKHDIEAKNAIKVLVSVVAFFA